MVEELMFVREWFWIVRGGDGGFEFEGCKDGAGGGGEN